MSTIKNKKHYYIYGSGEKTIVFLHGFLASSKYWKRLTSHFINSGYRVITIDLLGFGNAPKYSTTYNYNSHVTYINDIINKIGLDGKFTLVGHSMGALIALRYSIKFADKINSLVLLHPPIYRDTEQARATLRGTGPIYRFLLDSRYGRIGWVTLKIVLFPYVGKHDQRSRKGSLENVVEVAEILADLEQITVRTLLVVGLKDRPEYLDNLRFIKHNPLLKISIENTSHHSPLFNSAMVYRKISDYIRPLTCNY
jgi:pimeloyl-ACP methyl ester carboxylesterase